MKNIANLKSFVILTLNEVKRKNLLACPPSFLTAGLLAVWWAALGKTKKTKTPTHRPDFPLYESRTRRNPEGGTSLRPDTLRLRSGLHRDFVQNDNNFVFLRWLVVFLLPLGVLCSQSFQNAGSTGLQFLKIGMSARGEGMGGAVASFDGDISLLTLNPASIGSLDRIGLSIQHTTWVAETDLNFIGLVVPLSDQVNIALHTTYLTSGGIEITTIDVPEGTGQFYDVADVAVGLTSSIRLTSQLTFATTIKYVQERIYDVSSDGLSFDAGMWYATGFNSLNLGFVISNLGFEQTFSGKPLEVKYTPSDPAEPNVNAQLQAERYGLPLTFRASGSFDIFEMFMERMDDHQLRAAIDFVQNADTRERVLTGMEYAWTRSFFVRGGYAVNADELGWSGGAGTLLNLSGTDVQFDASASSLGRFGISYRIGLSILSN